MGADIIGWRGCTLQEELGADSFFEKLRLTSVKQTVEARLPEDKWPTTPIRLNVAGQRRDSSYPEIAREVGAFSLGIPGCSDCPISGGGFPIGCHRRVNYPVDATFERLLFAFFVSQVEREGSISEQLYHDFVCDLDPGMGWYEPRGLGPGTLAELARPLEHEWTDVDGAQHYVNSAMLLEICFVALPSPADVVAYTLFWAEFFEYIDAQTQDLEEIAGSRTIRALRHVLELLVAITPHALQSGWQVEADS